MFQELCIYDKTKSKHETKEIWGAEEQTDQRDMYASFRDQRN